MSSIAAAPGVPSTTPTGAGPGQHAGPALAWAGFLFVLLARGLRAMLITLVIVASIPLVSTWTGSVVRSGSMEPGMSVGDVIVAKPLPAGEPIPVGRVMEFDNPDTTSNHTMIIHRVVENLGSGQYTTAGDANREDDSTPVATEDFTARPLISVPFIGLPLAWWADRELGPLIFWLTLISVVLYFSIRPPCDPRHRRRREANAARRAAARAATGMKRVSIVLVPSLLLLVAIAAAPLGQANAAFSSSTRNPGNTWTASAALSKPLVLGDVPDAVRGITNVTATLNEGSGQSFSVRFEYAPAGSAAWQTICIDTTAPYSCSVTTTDVANGDYDLRAVATSGPTTYTSDVVENITIDNLAPTTVMQDPGTPLRGTVTTTATAADAHSGVAKVVIQYALSGSTTFRDVCTITDSPYSCRFDTTTVPAGTYTFHSVATDLAGNVTTSANVTNRVIDNSVASVSMQDPGAYLTGTVPLAATANASAGITSVRIQRAPAGSTTWTDICTDTLTPFTCSWGTTGVADGLYDLRAVMLDKAGKTTISASVTNRQVDNSPIRGFDVQTANGGSTAGKLDSGDTMTLTYTEQAALSSISSGWTGSAMAVTVRLRDGKALGLGSTDDTISVLRNGAAVNLGAVNLRQNYIGANRTAEFAATMVASTTTVDGVSATRVTLTVGSQTSGSATSKVSTSSVMIWTPSASATDVRGRAASTTPTSEAGTSDREF